MLLYRTKYFGVADSVRKAKSEYLDKLFKEAKEKIKDTELAKKRLRNNEEWKKCLDNERTDITKHYKSVIDDSLEGLDFSVVKRNIEKESHQPSGEVISRIYDKYKNKADNLGVDIVIDKNFKSSGRYDPELKQIILKNPKSLTLIHELEHAIQDRNEKKFRYLPGFGTGIAKKDYMRLYNGRENVHKYIKSVASEDGAIIAKTKKLYLEPDVPVDYVFAQHNTPYMQHMRAPLGDTNLMRNYADIYYKNWINPELYSKIKENAKKIGIDLEKKSEVNRTPGTPDVLERVKKWNLEKFGHSNIN